MQYSKCGLTKDLYSQIKVSGCLYSIVWLISLGCLAISQLALLVNLKILGDHYSQIFFFLN